ncbi:low affinity immunoglobulin gamma Fc region receptor II-a-like [Astatotilapia calliptera]|uniref:low affinity immunoglobulin gamma Fc region receptor II-a-like n=1 Tax=Astatotilapia calliptera TaxID=8154 RepID=UPI000E40AC3B|nr:low affinity immunoglobulin gamma Fc region receptor II-a-like [Astatotilapia calliptera]
MQPHTIKDSAFPQVVPNRQQFFELESISISCEGLNGLTGWRVMKKTKGHVRPCASTWETSTGPCNISNAYPSSDSGEYWCEIGGIQTTNTVNITVTDLGGPVILDSPVNPVTEGDNMALHCRKKDKKSNFTADFYKSGISIGHRPTVSMMNPTVSKSDEGVYKCSISDTGESAESWLIVRSLETRAQTEDSYFHLYLGVGVSMMVLLLLLAVTDLLSSQTLTLAVGRTAHGTSDC